MLLRYVGSGTSCTVVTVRPVGSLYMEERRVWSGENGFVLDVPEEIGEDLLEHAGDGFEKVEGERGE
jgi:hypothetical protein